MAAREEHPEVRADALVKLSPLLTFRLGVQLLEKRTRGRPSYLPAIAPIGEDRLLPRLAERERERAQRERERAEALQRELESLKARLDGDAP
ncbi:MAG: hypothetical protein ACTSU5_08475 [Promethearchaeota archaeon]